MENVYPPLGLQEDELWAHSAFKDGYGYCSVCSVSAPSDIAYTLHHLPSTYDRSHYHGNMEELRWLDILLDPVHTLHRKV
jgi:hypothetical protein